MNFRTEISDKYTLGTEVVGKFWTDVSASVAFLFTDQEFLPRQESAAATTVTGLKDVFYTF